MVFPYGYAKIYEADGRTVQYTSPTRNVWGGDTYTYTSPERSGGITRTTTGFLNSSTVYVDDSYPSGVYYSEKGDYWDVTGQPYAPVVSGSNSHVGASVSGEHQHWFQEAYPSISTPSGYFHVQYVYIPWNSVPSEIMLQFQDNEVSNAGFETCDFTAWSQSGMIIRGDYKNTGRCAAAPSYNGGTGVYSAYTLYQTFPAIAGSRVTAVQLWYIWGSGDTAYVLYSDGSSTATSLPYVGSMTLKNLGWDSTKQITGIEVIRPTGTGTNIVLDDIGVRAGVGTTSSVDWEHRAYWGANDIGWGTDGTGSRRNMGPIPAATNTWLELIVKTDDVGTNGLKIDGLAYTLYDGGVTWDYSALGGPLTGTVTIGGLSPGQRVELYDQNGALKTSATVPTGSTSAGLDAYGAGINVFPFSGYIKVYATSGSLLYSSPLMKDIWGGDVYTWNGLIFSNAFNPGPVGVTVHDVVIGQAQYQKQNSVPEESYSNYDAFGNLIQSTQLHNGSPLTSTYTYDQYGNVLSSVNANNEVENFAYPATYQHAYLTNVTQVTGGGTSAVTSFVYDFPTGNKVAVIDPLGNRTDYSYDAIGRPKVVRYPAVNGVRSTVNSFYGDSQNSIDVQSEKGNFTRTYFDGLGRKITVQHYVGSNSSSVLSIERYTYNWNNEVKTYTSPDGNVTSYSYDFMGRLTKITNPDNTYRSFSYDNVNLIQTNLDENQHRTDYVYNNVQRLVQVREYYSPTSYYTTSYTYDAVGNLVRTLDAKGQTVTYSYDDLNRPVLTTEPDQGTVTRTYDNLGNLATKKDPNGNTITYTYDNLNRVTKVSYPDSTTATFSYDKNGNRLSMSNSASSATFGYDARNRPVKKSWTIAGATYVQSYSYDSAGNLVGITYPDNTRVTYSMDALNRVTSVSVAGITEATLTYGSNLQVSSITYGNGVVTKYTYDKRGRTSEIKTNWFNTLLDLIYSYDNVGNLATVSGTNTEPESYSYDSLNRLTSSTGPWGTLGYGYDAVGNRVWMTNGSTNTTYTYGAYDRLASVGTTSNTYDNNGALKTESMGGCNTNTFSYDFESRLTSVTNGCSGTLATYSYSPLGIKIQAVESGTTTVYVSQGLNVLFEKQINAGTVTDYVFVGDQIIAKLAAGTTYFFHQDQLGNTRFVTSSKRINFSSNYEPFGPQYGASYTDQVYKYTGKPQDSVTGLYYYGARWYDPTIGRFISRDPKPGRLSVPGNLNPYVYALNNPLRFVDPTGMDSCAWWDAGCHAGSWWNGLSSQQQAWIVTALIVTVAVVAIAATVVTFGATAPLAAAAIGAAVGAASSSVIYTASAGDKATVGGVLLNAGIGALTGAIGGGGGGIAASIAAKGGLSIAAGVLFAGAATAGGNQLGKFIQSTAAGQSYQLDPSRAAEDFFIGAVTFGIGARIGANSDAQVLSQERVFGSISDYLGNGEVDALATYEGNPIVASVLDSTTNLITAEQLGYSVGTQLLGAIADALPV
jgi:RHS repeat-associated protein